MNRRLNTRRRGIALLVTMFFMILLSLMSLAYLELVPFEQRSAAHRNTREQGKYVSQTAVQSVWAWLRYAEDTTGNPLSGLTGVDTGNTGAGKWPKEYRLDVNPNRSQIAGFMNTIQGSNAAPVSDWASEVYLYPDTNTLNGGSPHVFRLLTIAKRNGQKMYACEYVLQQQTFAKYGFFSDFLPGGGYYPAFKDDYYDGEFHINGKMPIYVGNNLFTNFVKNVFNGGLSFSSSTTNAGNDGIAYQTSTVPFDGTGAEITDADGKGRYSKLVAGGKSGIKLGGIVPMPKTNTSTELGFAKAAWFGRNSANDSLSSQAIPAGLTVRDTGSGVLSGIYIKGDVRDLKLDVVDANGNSVARDATTGLINTGNSLTKVREEADAASATKYTSVYETRSTNQVLPVGSYRINSVTATPVTNYTIPQGKTAIVRAPNTNGNPTAQTLVQVMDGYPTGVTYVDGNIGKVAKLNAANTDSVDREQMVNNNASAADTSVGGISGVNYGQARTIAVNIAQNKYIRVAGDLTRGDVKPQPTGTAETTTSKRDGLGLVGYDVVIGSDNAYASSTPMYLQSLVMAGRRDIDSSNPTGPGTVKAGSVVYENWTQSSGMRVMKVFGSYVVGNDRLWGSLSNGYNPTFMHDKVLANSPPPFYPTRSDYVLLSHSEVIK